MAGELTKRQREILEFIQVQTKKRGFPPTVREIGAHFKIASPNGVAGHLRALSQKGYLRHEPGVSRGIAAVGAADAGAYGSDEAAARYPLVGEVAAGGPRLAVGAEGESLTLDEAAGGRPGDLLIEVKGDSMTGAGIYPGDKALVRPGLEVHSGQIAVVMVGEEDATLKRIFREKGGVIRLVPENPEYDTVVVDPRERPVRIVGRVVGVLRRY